MSCSSGCVWCEGDIQEVVISSKKRKKDACCCSFESSPEEEEAVIDEENPVLRRSEPGAETSPRGERRRRKSESAVDEKSARAVAEEWASGVDDGRRRRRSDSATMRTFDPTDAFDMHFVYSNPRQAETQGSLLQENSFLSKVRQGSLTKLPKAPLLDAPKWPGYSANTDKYHNPGLKRSLWRVKCNTLALLRGK